ncbi:MAG: primosomal protein N' [Omnitrophica WOR_2 bacterium RBG_13_44_8b]|nr:MAG: primosomal protein N' [Omnitrophica WOR_2 bacterium RBG_13_44_8b]
MLYAKIVVGLPVEGPFDYIVPANLTKQITIGSRAWVPFRAKKIVGYVVKVTSASNIKNLKKILDCLDEQPVLDKNMLALTKELSEYYCCSWGEAIDTALPDGIRKGKKIPSFKPGAGSVKPKDCAVILLQDLEGVARWDIYIKEIKDALSQNKSAIAIFPDINSVLKANDKITSGLNTQATVLYRNQPKELQAWVQLKQGKPGIAIGTRSAIFAPVNNLGLVIIDEEGDSVYKQDQEPHYHARNVALMRVNIEKAKLVLGATSPSLESFYLAKTNKIERLICPRNRTFPEVKLIDARFESSGRRKKQVILSRYLQDSIASVLSSSGKALLFINRRGFATFASCSNCGLVLKCPRCDINLVYHFKGNILNCHYCNFKTEAPSICPNCNSNYIRYTGAGAERVESELARIFANAKIARIDSKTAPDTKGADIFVATSAITKEDRLNFDLIGVIGIDNSLNRVDLGSSEKTFALLVNLVKLTQNKIIIQTGIPGHAVFQSLEKRDFNYFYEEELKTRKQLNFPPYRHIILIKLRGAQEEHVKQRAESLFEKLNAAPRLKSIRPVSLNPGQPSQLRGKFYWQALILSSDVKAACKSLKNYLKDFSHSGIIVTVDVDPL